MAYPPSVPTGTRINTTPQVNTHAADHNSIHAALTDIINELGANPSGDAADVSSLIRLENPVGIVVPFAGASAPNGWGLCDGVAISRSTYAELFAVIGTTYGVGDGSTTFNKPDLRSRFVAGKGTATWSDALAETGGSKDAVAVAHTHTSTDHSHTFSGSTNTDGAHPHSQTGYDYGANAGYLHRGAGGGWEMLNGSGTISATYTTPDVSSSGSSHAHGFSGGTSGATGGTGNTTASQTPTATGTDQNLPPYITLNYIIRLT